MGPLHHRPAQRATQPLPSQAIQHHNTLQFRLGVRRLPDQAPNREPIQPNASHGDKQAASNASPGL